MAGTVKGMALCHDFRCRVLPFNVACMRWTEQFGRGKFLAPPTVNNSKEEQTLFDAARKLSDPARRKAFLESACHDAELRREVETMLETYETRPLVDTRTPGDEKQSQRTQSFVDQELAASAASSA